MEERNMFAFAISLRNAGLGLFKKGSFSRNTILLMFGTALSQVIQFVVWPVLTRLYDPSSFGYYATYMAVVAIGGSVIALKYDQALVLPKEEACANALLRLGVAIVAALSLVALLATVICWGRLATLMTLKEKSNIVLLIPLSLMSQGLITLYTNWNIRNKTFNKIMVSSIAQVGLCAGVQIVLALFSTGGVVGLLVGQIVGEALALTLLLPRYWSRNFRRGTGQIAKMVEQARRYKEFPSYMVMAGLLNVTTTYVPVFLLGRFFSPATVGLFALSQRVIRAPMTLVGSNVATVFVKKAHELASSDALLLKKKTFQMSLTMLATGLFPMAVLLCFSPHLFRWFFGARWEMAGSFTQVMSIYLLLQFAFTPLAILFRILEKQRLYSLWEWLRFIVCVTTMFLGGKFCSALGAVTIFSTGMSLSYVVLAYLAWHILSQPATVRIGSRRLQTN